VDPVAVAGRSGVSDPTPVTAAARANVLHFRRKPLKKASIQIDLAHFHRLALCAGHRDLRTGFQRFGLFAADNWKRHIVIV